MPYSVYYIYIYYNMSTEIDSVLDTVGVTAPTTFTVETNDNYNLEYVIAPYGTRGYKMINTINVKDKNNEVLAICNFPTSPPFWKDYVAKIALDFSFNYSEPIMSTLRVTLKTPIPVEREDAVAPSKKIAPGFNELGDIYIVDSVEENADNITVLTFKVDPKNFEDREQVKRRQAFRYGGRKSKKSSKNKKSYKSKKSYKKSNKTKSKKKNKRRGF